MRAMLGALSPLQAHSLSQQSLHLINLCGVKTNPRLWWLLLSLPALVLYLLWTYILAPYVFTASDEVWWASPVCWTVPGALQLHLLPLYFLLFTRCR